MIKTIKYILFASIISLSIIAKSQCPTSDFTTSGTFCIDQRIDIQNNSSSTTKYIWDFCEGDLSETPTSELFDNVSGSGGIRGLEIIEDNGQWYGFVTNRDANTIYRYTFGEELSNISPGFENLGNLGGILNAPTPIKFRKEGNDWYGLVHNRGTSEIVRLDFGSSLSNTPSVNIVVSGYGDSNTTGMDIGVSNDSLIVTLSHFSSPNITQINFGNSITNIPTIADIKIESVLSGAYDIALVQSCGDWYGFIVNYNVRKVIKLDFGLSLFSNPSMSDVVTLPSGDNPFGLTIDVDQGRFFAHVITQSKKLFQVELGDNLSTPGNTLNDLGLISANLPIGLDFEKDESHWYGFVGDLSRNIYRVNFPNDCSASPESSFEETPRDISFSSAGTYNITLAARSDVGVDYFTESVTVTSNSAPDIDFSTSFPISCTSNPIGFTAVSSADDIQFYNWDFGDGNTSTDENPTHTYASPGTYDVKLSVTDADPCENFTIGSITIYEDPISTFDVPAGVVCNNQPVTFVNTTPDSFEGNETFEWQVDGITVSNSRDLDYEFTSGGTFEVKLITSIPGCSDEVAQNFNVTEGPSPNFTVSDACVSTLFDFSNTTTGDNIVSYEWDFDNGFMSSQENPDPFEYDSPGTYNVTLTTQNAAGCITSIEKLLTVYDPPVVDFSNELSCELDPTQFSDLSTVNNANIESWQWDFGDPASGTNSSTEQNPQHVFSQSGDFDVTLITTTTFGCIDSLTQVVSVNQAPIANFSFDKVCIGEEIQFQDESEAVPGEQITNWAWNLGGQFSAEQNPTTTFDFAIDYNVSLTVTSQNLCSNTSQETITVYPAKEVGFKVEDACENVLVHLYDTTQQTGDPIVGRFWQLADQGSAMDSSVFNDFATAGNYDVTLGVTTERGCEYERTQIVTVNEAPEASFEASNVFGAPPLEVGFTDNSNQAISHSWDFGDGNTSNLVNPNNTFNEEGSYNVSLAIEDANGCRDTTNLIINALVPELELELIQVTIVEKKIVLTMINNGTLSIDSMQASVNLGDRVTIEEDIILPLPASNDPDAINYTLDLNLASRNIDYVCVTLNPILNGAEDANQLNNTKCKNFDSDIIFVKPYPNPAKDQLNITVMSETEGNGSVRIVSSIGEIVLSENFDGLRGKNDLQLDVSSIKGGVYLVEVEMAGFKSNSRVAIDN